jgi:hypothetical protein
VISGNNNVTRGNVFSGKCTFREMVREEMKYGESVHGETVLFLQQFFFVPYWSCLHYVFVVFDIFPRFDAF